MSYRASLPVSILTALLSQPNAPQSQQVKPNDTPAIPSSFLFSGIVGAEKGIFLQTPSQPKPVLIIKGENWPIISPDGKRLLYQCYKDKAFDVWSADLDGRNRKRLTSHKDHDYLPAWSPDGRWVVFTSWRKEPEDAERSTHLYLMSSDGSKVRRIHDATLGTSAGASFAPDGRQLVFSKKVGNQPADIFIGKIDLNGDAPITEIRQLTNDQRYNSAAEISPDGKQIAFYSSVDDESRIEIMNIDGSNRRVLVNGGQNWSPRWSADGNWLAFVKQAGDSENELDLFAVTVENPTHIVPLVELEGRQTEICLLPD